MANRKLIVEIVGDSKSLERTFQRAGRASTGFSRQLGGLRASLAAIAAPTAIGLFGAAAIRQAAEFESTMQKVVGLSGVAQGKIAGLTGEILKLAPAVGRGPAELAEGLQFITSSGIAAGDAMGVLEVSAKAAAAGLGETKTVADAVTSVMNAYGASAVNAEKATDVLVATVREGKGEASDFAGVIGNVVSIASQLGVSFEDVGAALAAMTRLGTDAETSATQLQQVFSNLVKVTPQQAKAFAAVGLSAAGLRKEISEHGLLAGLETIKTAFAGDLPGLAKAFGDIRALRGVLALVGKQADATRGIFERLNSSAGSLDKSFGAVGDTASQQFRKLNAAVDVTRITIGAALAPAAEKAAEAITGWLSVSENQEKVQRGVESAVKNVSAVVRGAVDAFRDIRDVLEPVVDRLGGVGKAAKLLATFLVVGKIVAYSRAVTGLGDAALTSAGKVNALGLALRRLTAIGAIVIGIELAPKVQDAGGWNRFLKGLDEQLANVGDTLGGSGIPGIAAAGSVLAGLANLDKAQREANLDQLADKLRAISTEGVKAASRVEEIRIGAAPGSKNASTIATSINKTIDFFTKTASDAADKAQAAIVTAAKGSAKQKVAAEKAAAAAKEAADKQRSAFDSILDSLHLKFDQAAATTGLKDDLAALDQVQKAIESQVRVEGKTTELERQLFQIRQQRLEIRKQMAEQSRQSVQAAQFKALGFDSTGGELVSSTQALRKQLGSAQDAIKGTFLDTGKTSALLAKVRNVLSGGLGKLGTEVRSKINEILTGLTDQLSGKEGPLTKTSTLNSNKIIDSLGLSGDVAKQLRVQLAKFNSAGVRLAPSTATTAFGQVVPRTQDVVVHSTIELDGKVVANNTTRHQQKKSRKNPAQKRGPTVGGRF